MANTPTEMTLMKVQQRMAAIAGWNSPAFRTLAGEIDETGKALADLTIAEYFGLAETASAKYAALNYEPATVTAGQSVDVLIFDQDKQCNIWESGFVVTKIKPARLSDQIDVARGDEAFAHCHPSCVRAAR